MRPVHCKCDFSVTVGHMSCKSRRAISVAVMHGRRFLDRAATRPQRGEFECPLWICLTGGNRGGIRQQMTPLLEIEDLRVAFDATASPVIDGVSLVVRTGEAVALIGESGCGKSLTALSVLRLIPSPPAHYLGGSIRFCEPDSPGPVELLSLREPQLRRVRGDRIAMIFQEPMTSLHPTMTIGKQIAEVIARHSHCDRTTARDRAVECLRQAAMPAPERRARQYPHELSGGMRQRAMIAMALSCNPALLIADEPTTALDVTTQRQIIELLDRIRRERNMGLLLITHDLELTSAVAERAYVMYAGRIVESAPTKDLLHAPLHPYTAALLGCRPHARTPRGLLTAIPGQVPPAGSDLGGCRFHPRCALTRSRAIASSRTITPCAAAGGEPVLRRCIESFADEPSGVPLLTQRDADRAVACWET